jgi:AcrR family transcriptional regulator
MASAQTPAKAASKRKTALSAARRELILAAARRVFEADGLEGASLRAIAAEAGYTPAALYFHFESKEALYDALLHESLAGVRAAVEGAADTAGTDPSNRFRAAAMSFFDVYAERPRDLDMGFYLFRGGMGAKGLGRARDQKLNAALMAALKPISEAAHALGASEDAALHMTADVFAHASGLLLLMHTGRVRMFAVTARDLMARHVDMQLAALETR